jgi:hypothetical protein
MSGTVRARMKHGHLELLDKVDLPEGDVEAFERSAGSWTGTVDADALIEHIYADRSRPSDRPVPRL